MILLDEKHAEFQGVVEVFLPGRRPGRGFCSVFPHALAADVDVPWVGFSRAPTGQAVQVIHRVLGLVHDRNAYFQAPAVFRDACGDLRVRGPERFEPALPVKVGHCAGRVDGNLVVGMGLGFNEQLDAVESVLYIQTT